MLIVETWINYFDNCLTVDFLRNRAHIFASLGSPFPGSRCYVRHAGKWYHPCRGHSQHLCLSKWWHSGILPYLNWDHSSRWKPFYWSKFQEHKALLFWAQHCIVMDRTAVNRSYDEYISDELKRDIFVEKDPTKNCVKYPNAEYDSYNQCDKNFNLRKLEESYVPKILPI